jgi:hypothetical protein
MGETTTLRSLNSDELRRIPPRSETHFRKIQAVAREQRGGPGDAAWAAAEREKIEAIHKSVASGSMRACCPACADRGVRTILLDIGEESKCGTCGWKRPGGAPMV